SASSVDAIVRTSIVVARASGAASSIAATSRREEEGNGRGVPDWRGRAARGVHMDALAPACGEGAGEPGTQPETGSIPRKCEQRGGHRQVELQIRTGCGAR